MATIVRSKSSFLTPTMMFISLEPWSIMRTLMLALAIAENSVAAVPMLSRMRLPTVAMSARLRTISTLSGSQVR